jgi:hypothetical protein
VIELKIPKTKQITAGKLVLHPLWVETAILVTENRKAFVIGPQRKQHRLTRLCWFLRLFALKTDPESTCMSTSKSLFNFSIEIVFDKSL